MSLDIENLFFDLETILYSEVDEDSIKDFKNITEQMLKYLEKRLNRDC